MERTRVEQDGVTVELTSHPDGFTISVTGTVTGAGAVTYSVTGDLLGFVDFHGGEARVTTIPVAVSDAADIPTRIFDWVEGSGVRL